MTATTCKLCDAPLSTCACVTDEHLAARFAAMRQPPLREFLGARERIRVRQFPDVVAGEQTEWSALAIEAIGDTPAARAATHLDHQRWVRQQLSLRTDDIGCRLWQWHLIEGGSGAGYGAVNSGVHGPPRAARPRRGDIPDQARGQSPC